MLVKVLKLTDDEISNTAVSGGQVLYGTDSNKVYYDNTDNTRMITTSIIPLSTEITKDNYVNPEPDKLYLVLSSYSLYKYVGEWIRVTDTGQVSEVLFQRSMLTPIIMNENGVDIAPATIASNVFTEDGDNIEGILNNLLRLYDINSNKLKVDIKTVDVPALSIRIEIPFPIENFLENGNSLIIFINDKFFNTNYYSIDENYVIINEDTYSINQDSVITFLFIYNSSENLYNGDINGTKITPYSIPINRLQCTTNKIDMNNELYIPTSKALYALQQEVKSLCANGNPVVTTKVAISKSYVTAVANRQIKFEIPFPFENYTEYGNDFLLFDGSFFIDDRRYHIVMDAITNKVCVVLDDTCIKKGDQLTFIFIYNTSSGNGALNPNNIPNNDKSYRFREMDLRSVESYTSIAYGNGLFVAISNSNSNERILITSDGEQWDNVTMNIDVDWASICHGNDTFVAVGSSNTNSNCVAISNDAINWNQKASSDNSAKWSDVCYGNDTFVAVAKASVNKNRTIMRSIDNGNTWIGVRSPITEGLNKVIFGNNRFVALSENSIIISNNSINWSIVNKKITDICYREGRYFYIISNNDKPSIFGYTEDFINFVESDLGKDRHPRKICNGEDYMYIFCDNTGSSNDVIITDGFNVSNNIIVESKYEYDKFNFTHGNGLLIGINPNEHIAIVSGKAFFPELANLYYKK